jgi:8-oxo-dGTP pyrophosphatase MutT (NUDIX family)
MKTVDVAGGVIVNDSGEIVVVEQGHQENPSWSFPKGHVEGNEDFLTAAKREIEEETGLTELECIREFPVYERHRISKDGSGDDENELKRLHFFHFKTKQMKLRPHDPENPSAKWVTKEEVLKTLTHRKDREFFRGIMNEI